MTIRNHPAHANGLRAREVLREILSAHPPLAKPLTLNQLQRALRVSGIYLACSTIAWHRERIWREALGRKTSNSSGPDSLLGCD